MQTLEAFIARKCRDSEFLGIFNGGCTVCGKTVELIGKIHSEGWRIEELAEKAGVSVRELTELEEMDCCSYELVEKLCLSIGLEPPRDCRKRLV